MKKNILLNACLFFAVSPLTAQQLTAIEIPDSEPIIYGEVLWLDVNNDDRLELLLCGDGAEEYSTQLFNNTGLNELTLDTESELEPLSLSSSDKADFNNDGFDDFIMTGLNEEGLQITNLYLNNTDGTFSKERLDVTGVTNGKIRTANFNADTYQDFILTGIDTNYSYVAELYFQNETGEFVLQEQDLMGNYFGDITIFDADNDGDSDLLLTGFDNTYAPNSAFYLNDGAGVFEINEGSGIEPVYFSGTSASDYDNDGDLDLLINGTNSTYVPETWIYDNDGVGNFTANETVDLMGLFFGTNEFVDINGDEFEDLFLTGSDNDGALHSVVYLQSEEGAFNLNEALSDTIIDVNICSSKWSDYDNDGDQDLVITGFNFDGDLEMMLYTNDLFEPTYASVDANEAYAINIYPNPSSGEFHIQTDYIGLGQITITDLSGNVIWNETANFPLVNVSPELSAGVYFIKVLFDKNLSKQKLIIQ